MKTKISLLAILLVALTITSNCQVKQEYKVQFEKARYIMETKGDLKQAISLFESLIKIYPEEKKYAANSQLMIGVCHEKLGHSEASKAYQLVVDKYSDQEEVVSMARQKLAQLNKTSLTVKPDGITTREVWTHKEDTYHVSPDGRYISYIDWNSLSTNIHDTKTGKDWKISEKGTWEGDFKYPDASIFSPDSKHLLYVWYDGDIVELRIASIDGSDTSILVKESNKSMPWPLGWSDDGKSILVIYMEQGQNGGIYQQELATISIDTGVIEKRFSLNDKKIFHAKLSKDNQSILYDKEQVTGSEIMDIFLKSPDGKEIPIVEHPANDWYPFWTNDENYVVFLSDRTGDTGIWSQKMNNGLPVGQPTPIKRNLESSFKPLGITPEGSLYYGTGTLGVDVYSASVDFGTGEVLSEIKKISLRFEGTNTHPSYSPNGKLLAYRSDRSNKWMDQMIIVIQDLETGKEYDLELDILPGCPGGWFMIRWSPDSRYLLFPGRGKSDFDNPKLYLVDIISGELKEIFDDKIMNWTSVEGAYPQFGPDGYSIFYMNNTRSLQKLDLGSMNTEEIFKSDSQISYMELSPDGKFITFQYWFENRNQLWIVPATGGSAQKIGSLPEDETIRSLAWTPDSKNIILIAHKSSEIYKFSIDGTEPLPLGIRLAQTKHLRIHPDGKQLVFFHGPPSAVSRVWEMKNFLPTK